MSLICRDLYEMGRAQLEKAGVENSKGDAEALMLFEFSMTKKDLILDWGRSMDDTWCERYFGVIERRASGEPLQYILGSQNFMGYEFKVNESVLIPRPETEYMVEQAGLCINSDNPKKPEKRGTEYFYQAVKSRRRWKVLDLCCGSGCIGISLAKRHSNVKVVAADISEEALRVAQENNSILGGGVKFAMGDLFEAIGSREKYDLIISNPPYIKSDVIPTLQREVKDHEPMLALDGGKDGLDCYRRICAQAGDYLEKDGVLLMEIGYDQADEIKDMLEDTKLYRGIWIIKDLAGLDRIIAAVK